MTIALIATFVSSADWENRVRCRVSESSHSAHVLAASDSRASWPRNIGTRRSYRRDRGHQPAAAAPARTTTIRIDYSVAFSDKRLSLSLIYIKFVL